MSLYPCLSDWSHQRRSPVVPAVGAMGVVPGLYHSYIHPEAAADMTCGDAPGQPIPATPSFPAAATTMTSAAMASSIAFSISVDGVSPPRLMVTIIGAKPAIAS